MTGPHKHPGAFITCCCDEPLVTPEATQDTAMGIASGGGFRNALGKLRTLELVEGRGEVRASGALMGGR